MLPILHLNGYKIASPTILARIPKDELRKLFEGYGYKPYFVEGHEPETVHRQLAAVMDAVVAEIQQIWSDARTKGVRGPARVADDRAAHAEGLDVPGGDRRQEVRGLLARRTRCRWATWTSPGTSRSSKRG